MISIIAAVAQNGVIGSGNQMPWHLSEDLKRFKSITGGHTVLMGRKTFESLGRPLPGRRNIVVTRNASFSPEGVQTVRSLEEALGLFTPDDEVFIIGGGEIYTQAMPLADRLYITWIFASVEGDTYFPQIDPDRWEIVSADYRERGAAFAHPFEFTDYVVKTNH